MRIGDILYFSPNVRFADLDFADESRILEAFHDRVRGFYLAPAGRSLEAGDAFAGGLLCCMTIELLASFLSGEDPSAWLLTHVDEFAGDKQLAQSFW